MTEGMPWSVKGIEPDIRHDAFHAAHASGMTLGQWLNGVIRDTIVDIRAQRGQPAPQAAQASHSQVKQETAGTPMTHYPAQQPYPYAAMPPYMAPPPPYAMPAAPYPAPFASPYGAPPPGMYPGYPPVHAVDPFEARLRAYAGTETAIGSVPGAEKMLKVLDAAVRSSEQKTAAAIEALATLMDKQRKADADAQARQATLQAAHARKPADDLQQAQAQAMREIETARAELQSTDATRVTGGQTAEVTKLLSTMADRLAGLEKSFAAVTESRSQAQMAQARDLEDRIGGALETLAHSGQANLRDPDDAPMAEAAPAVRPPPRAQARPRITVPRSSAAVTEIAARQRLLDGAQPDFEPRATPESAALDAIRRSIAALADQVRETARTRDRRSEPDIRGDLKDLQRSVQELAPRQIVASVNESIRALAHKIEQSRHEGVRESQLAPVEALLNDMRVSLMELREPRGLNAINETLGQLARRLDAMGEKSTDSPQLAAIERQLGELRSIVSEARASQPIDSIRTQIAALTEKLDLVAERPRDTRVMSLLADAVDDVRKTMGRMDPEAFFTRIERRLDGLEGLGSRIDALSERLTTDGTVTAVPVDLGGLTARIEQMTQTLSRRTGEPDLSPIMQRMDQMQQSIEKRSFGTETKTLESILRRLADRIEDVRAPDANSASFDELQGQMSLLAERLDRATPNHPALGGLEKTLSDLCQKVASLQDTTALAAQDAVRTAVMQTPPGIDTLAAEGMMLIKRDLTEMKSAQADAEARSRDVLQQVNGTLEKIVSRLANLETDGVPTRRAPETTPTQPVAPPRAQVAPQHQPAPSADAASAGRPAPNLARPPVAAPQPQPQQAAPQAAVPRATAAPLTAAAAAPKNFVAENDLDLPLEPGAGRAAVVPAGVDGGQDPRSNFIAAARRAAQAAAAQTATAMAEMNEREAEAAHAGGRMGGLKSAIAARRKPILLGVAALMVALGGMQVVTQFLGSDPGHENLPEPAPRQAAAPAEPEAAPAAKVAEAPSQGTSNTEQMAIANQPPATIAAPNAPAPSTSVAPPAASNAPATNVAALVQAAGSTLPEKLKQAALSGNLSAAYEAGARLAEGRNGTNRDLKAAAQWLELAAAQGFAPAQYRFGSFNREGLGVTKDSKTAFVWFQRAAEQGNILAMHNLAVLYAEGVNGAEDYANAAQWFRNAAENGVKDSQFNIAILYLRGLGVAQDMVEAYKWFAAAARQGDPDAIKKRDTLLAQLPADKQEAAKQAAEAFRARKPDLRANEIIVPEGGWDDRPKLPSMAVPPKKAKSV